MGYEVVSCFLFRIYIYAFLLQIFIVKHLDVLEVFRCISWLVDVLEF